MKLQMHLICSKSSWKSEPQCYDCFVIGNHHTWHIYIIANIREAASILAWNILFRNENSRESLTISEEDASH